MNDRQCHLSDPHLYLLSFLSLWVRYHSSNFLLPLFCLFYPILAQKKHGI